MYKWTTQNTCIAKCREGLFRKFRRLYSPFIASSRPVEFRYRRRARPAMAARSRVARLQRAGSRWHHDQGYLSASLPDGSQTPDARMVAERRGKKPGTRQWRSRRGGDACRPDFVRPGLEIHHTTPRRPELIPEGRASSAKCRWKTTVTFPPRTKVTLAFPPAVEPLCPFACGAAESGAFAVWDYVN